MATGARSSPRLASWREPSIPLRNYLEGFAQAPSKLGLPVGGAITLDVALKVLIVKSANDVAVMIAETVAGSEEAFVARMNEAAQHLGMTRTTFTNVNGLPDERQVTTARDLAKLARAIIVEFPEHANLFSLAQVQVGKKTMRTHNSLLVSLPGADGMKTGFICESGFNVVASATRDRRKLVAVVLGEPSVASRNDRTTDLLESGFKRYFWKSLFRTSLDRLAIQAPFSNGPTHLRDSVCGVAMAKSTVRRSVKSKVARTRSPGVAAPASAVSASEEN
jgi:D-alanyl-D-alanine carboxypeptidase